MKLKLTRQDLQRLAALSPQPGEQYSVNHDDCPAGEDTRGRLSYRLADDNRLLMAHCFNCGRSGVMSVRSRLLSAARYRKPEELKEEYNLFDSWMDAYSAAEPLDFGNKEMWPGGYFASCWTEFCDAEKFGIRETPHHYIIPRGNVPNDITGFEIRPKGLKYYTRIIHPMYKEDSKLLIYNKDSSRIGVVCEDPISAMKVSLAGFAGVALCGATLSVGDALKLSLLFDKVVVWLDNDSKTVKEQAHLNRARLAMYMDGAYLVEKLSDPKSYTLSFVRSTIEDCVKEHE